MNKIISLVSFTTATLGFLFRREDTFEIIFIMLGAILFAIWDKNKY